MENLAKEINELLEKTAVNRRQFLQVEVQTSFLAVDKGHLEFSLGNTVEAAKEYEIARRGVEVIERFLQEAQEPLPNIEGRLVELKRAVRALYLKLERNPD
jgi:hypothetical protein